jgi:hypothetical protein
MSRLPVHALLVEILRGARGEPQLVGAREKMSGMCFIALLCSLCGKDYQLCASVLTH